jgi:hypothetical protein
MLKYKNALLGLAICLGLSAAAQARIWTDSTGNYKVEADLVTFNDKTVVLKEQNHDLVALPIDKLSQADQLYLQSKEVAEATRKAATETQTWTLVDGLKVVGRVVDYGRKPVTIQRRRGKIYVNDRLYDNLPPIYQQLVLDIISHFEQTKIANKSDLENWVIKLKADPKTYSVDGVVMEFASGDEYEIPLFMFTPDDFKLVKPGWERWLAEYKDHKRLDEEAFLLQAQAKAYQEDRANNHQIAMMQLQLQAYQAGLFDLWEVYLIPGGANVGPPLSVVVPAQDSRGAAQAAMAQHPGYTSGAIRMVGRKY